MPRREVLLLALAFGLPSICISANNVAVPLFFYSKGLSPLLIGELYSLGYFVNSTLVYIFSVIGDAWGRRKATIVLNSIYVASLLTFYYFRVYYLFAVFFTFTTGGNITALLAEKADDSTSAFSLASSVAISLGVIGYLISGLLPYSTVFLIEVFVLLSSLLLYVYVKENYSGTGRLEFNVPSLRKVSKFTFQWVIGFGAGLVLPLFSLWWHLRFSLDRETISLISIISSLVVAGTLQLAPFIRKKFGGARAVAIMFGFQTLATVLLPFSPIVPIAVVLYLTRNVLSNLSNPIILNMLTNSVRKEEIARADSFLSAVNSYIRTAGPSVSGYLFSEGNFYLSFELLGLIYTSSLIMFIFLFRSEITK
ncbi:MFS transporter [Sulfodiicoccus acidiphilus]|uniref:MFS transporter n=1 Tax=Sulfodiicoccus acidiphilus TaxID=1670455 RepID=A0A348B280_9CREN|nr:MFS transporter [Sulfodiicoccus acidiphilus]BBD72282.1 MFS transporter [Sulfodiicoccus acidiphilus]GGT90569.1 MFS transporter [Sulfodiicoccus acidiphilus]